jgi:Putative prokaryotic signal transducing protein
MNAGEEGLIGVAHATDRAEAEMIQGLLKSAGIPSVLQQVGIDGPLLGVGWLNPGGGSQRVMVRASQSEEAQALLANSLADGERVDWPETADSPYPEETGGRKLRSYGLIGAHVRIWAWSFGAMILAFAVFLLLREV